MKTLLALTILFSFSLGFAKPEELRFRPYTKVTGQKKIKLGDLIENKSELGKGYRNLQNLVLGDTPLLGEKRVFSSQFISQIIRKHLSNNKISIRIPNRIVVANRGFELNESAVERKLLAAWKASCQGCRIFIRSMNLPSVSTKFSSRPWSLSLKPGLPRGAFTEKILITGSDNQKQTYWVTGQLEVQKKVPVTSRSLNSQARIQSEDFRMEWRDVTYATDGTLIESDLLGQSVKFGIPANQIIWANSVARKKAVRRGDLVRVVSGEGSWQVSMRAVTEQDGFVGDRVNLRNIETKKMLTGEVVGPGEVVVQ